MLYEYLFNRFWYGAGSRGGRGVMQGGKMVWRGNGAAGNRCRGNGVAGNRCRGNARGRESVPGIGKVLSWA
jgi:hypothetical protein